MSIIFASITSIILEIEQAVYEYNLSAFQTLIHKLIDELAQLTTVDDDDQAVMNEILGNITIAMENRDYILVADILSNDLTRWLLTSERRRRIQDA